MKLVCLMIADRLNGWQRLWVVGALLWLVVVLWIVGRSFPTEEKTVQARQAQMLEALRFLEAQLKEIDDHCKLNLPDFTATAECYKVNAQGRENTKRSYRETIESLSQPVDLSDAQFTAVWKGLTLWVIPLAAVYLLGLGIAWVRKGFARSRP